MYVYLEVLYSESRVTAACLDVQGSWVLLSVPWVQPSNNMHWYGLVFNFLKKTGIFRKFLKEAVAVVFVDEQMKITIKSPCAFF